MVQYRLCPVLHSYEEYLDETEQAEQGKIQNVLFEEKKDTRKCKQIKEKPGAKWSTESGDLRARPHPAKLPICGKQNPGPGGDGTHL